MGQRYDIAIIGSGPAGISAALTAKARGKNILLLGKGDVSTKVSTAHQINNYPGLPAVSGEAFAKAMADSLRSMDIEVTKEQVSTVYAMGDYFSLQTGSDMYEASAVILATGVAQSHLLPGEENFLGRGVSYCATCDAQFYRGKTVTVLGYTADAAEEAAFLAEVAEKVYYLPAGKAGAAEAPNLETISGKPVEIRGSLKVSELVTDEGVIETDGVFILRDAVAPDKLVPGLKTVDGHVEINLQMETNLPGLFAAGDCAGLPYQYIKGAGQGNVAALSAVSYLAKQKQAKA